ncbi:MAG TPA: DUF2807 domain-containing protein [Rhizomicrobium sp.]|jgi:hypothetical protein|nr:DUF2807 domain-containing protein [Rhizomicrobium sp.]
MPSSFLTTTAVTLLICAASIGAAAAVGGPDFSPNFSDGFSLFDGRPRCQAVTGATATSREMDWDGSDKAGLSLMGEARYTPGAGDKLQASGDPQVLAHLRIRNGTVEMDCRGWRDRTKDVVVNLPGRTFEKFHVSGGRLILNRLDQQHLSVSIAGSGKVQANGKAEEVKFSIAGSGEMNLDQITASRGEMKIAGSGTMRAGSVAIGELEMGIAGSGRAEFGQLRSRAAEIGIAGSGTVIAKGAADNLKIDISGSGRADFGEVVSRTTDAEISGHGEVAMAPSETARIRISGSGDVYLRSNPGTLDTKISGSGRIHRGPGT